jgi:hypothetical protein
MILWIARSFGWERSGAVEATDRLPRRSQAGMAPALFDEAFSCVGRKSNPYILMMQPAQNRPTIDVPCPLNSTRYWRILLDG